MNPYITSLSLQNIKLFFTGFTIGMYQPLTSLSFALNYKLTGLDPAGFHAVNLFLHLINTLLVFVLIRRISKRAAVALLTCLFFGIHPMFAESVAWISERKDVLFAFFFLLSLIFYLEYVRKNKGLIFYILSFILFVCAVLSKTTAILLPVILLLADWYLVRKFSLKQFSEKIPFFLVSIVIAVVSLYSQYTAIFTDNISINYNLLDRPFLISYSILFYIGMFFCPVKLSIIHPYPEKAGSFLPVHYYISLVMLGILIVLLYKIISRLKPENRRLIIFGISFFIIMLLLSIQILPLPGFSVTAERYAYMPYIGLFFIFSTLILNFLEKFEPSEKRKKYILYLVVSVFIGFFSFSTYSRNKDWKDNFSIFSDAIKKHPDAAMAYNNRGLAYYQSGNMQKALSDFQKATQLKPKLATYFYNMGNAYLADNNYTMAIKCYTQAITNNPSRPEASYINRGIAYQKAGLYIASFWDLTSAIKCNGQFKAIAYFNRGGTLNILNDRDGACADWKASLNLGYADAQKQLSKYCK
jgi:4-amino-4-deoxy-L-arabinose transferase-like glycosyltransferase